MISIQGKWYDGRTSAEVSGRCIIYENGSIRVEADLDGQILCELPGPEFRISPPVGQTPRFFYFPSGEKFETDDHDSLERIERRFKRTSFIRIVHCLESRTKYILAALLILALILWVGMEYGVPAIAKELAFRLPQRTLSFASNQSLEVLDRTLLGPSELDEATRTRLRENLGKVTEDFPDGAIRILFRKGGHIGPNAFALPDGRILFTDEMIQMTEHDGEISAVLAHEIGHVIHRHGMRSLIQDSLLGFALVGMTGDVSGSSELFLGLPVLLTELAYSREFERQADEYALSTMHKKGIPAIHFANLMRRLDKAASKESGESRNKWSNYISSHPPTSERIIPFLEEP